MKRGLQKLTIVTSEDKRDRYSAAILAILRRVEVSEGDILIKKELAPLYDLLELLRSAKVKVDSKIERTNQ